MEQLFLSAKDAEEEVHDCVREIIASAFTTISEAYVRSVEMDLATDIAMHKIKVFDDLNPFK